MSAFKKRGLSHEAQRALKSDVASLVPRGRMGTVTELAKAALYLSADEYSDALSTERWEWRHRDFINLNGAEPLSRRIKTVAAETD